MPNQTKKRATSNKAKPVINKNGKPVGKQIDNNDIMKEIVIILVIALSFVMVLGVFTESTGAFGAFVKQLLLGLFGIGAYFLPFAVIIYGGFILIKEKPFFTYKTITAMLLFVFLFSLAHVLSNQPKYDAVFDYYKNGYWNNGGLVGGLLGEALSSLFGKIGTYIFVFAVSVISFILITGKSFFKIMDGFIKLIKETFKSQERKPVKPVKIKKPERKIEEYEDDDYLLEEVPIIPTIAPKKKEIKIEPPTEHREIHILGFNDPEPVQPKVDEELPSIITGIIEPKPQTAEERIAAAVLKGTEAAKPTETTYEEPSIPLEEGEYEFPSIELLQFSEVTQSKESKEQMLKNAKKLEMTLGSFGVEAKVVQINTGPTVTRYELAPSAGVKVSKIVGLADDIALNLAAAGIRIEAPIPGKAAVGIEVPNKERETVYLREVLQDEAFIKFPSKLAFGLGKDIAGVSVVADIAKMPHLLIAGATGAGKSVCINTLVTSILYKATPKEVKLLMIDPKVVELSVYNGIPHLLIPVVTDPKKAAGALNWAVQEMINRYKLFADFNVRDMKGYNAAVIEKEEGEPLPQIVIIIDELADLMMAAPGEVEDSICRLAQMARAAGLHLIIATQRPSVDVITGVIKANVPSRLAFAVSSGTDSRTILDTVGAEKLLGKGDMLFYPAGMTKPIRVQGALVSDKEVESIVTFLKSQTPVEYDQAKVSEITSSGKNTAVEDNSDEFLEEAIKFIVDKEKASVSMLQRQFRIGYNRAARIMEELEARRLVGPEDGSKPRKVLITKNEYYNDTEQ